MASWEWKSGDGWIPYDDKSNLKIIKAAKKNKTSVEVAAPSGTVYVIDLIGGKQVQKNAPSRARRIRWNDGSLPRSVPKVVHTHTVTTTVVPQPVSSPPGGSVIVTGAPPPAIATVSPGQPQFVQQMPMQQLQTMGVVQTQQPTGPFAIPPTGYPPASPVFTTSPSYTQAPLPAYGSVVTQGAPYQQQQTQYAPQQQFQHQHLQSQAPPQYYQQPQYAQAQPTFGGYQGGY